jgi:hypothetical protein
MQATKKTDSKKIPNWCFRRTKNNFENTVSRSDRRIQLYQGLSDSVVSLTSASQDTLQVYLRGVRLSISLLLREFAGSDTGVTLDTLKNVPPQLHNFTLK